MIDRFSGKYRFLSNFYPSIITINKMPYPTVEHAYQAQKQADQGYREFVMNAPTPGDAKKRGRRAVLREDWEQVKLTVMLDCLLKKFDDPKLKQALMETHPHELIEGNHWGDTYWGVCNGVGLNQLGALLMFIRDEEKGLMERI